MREQHELQFCFKGTRNYVQGPDIFDAVVDILMKKFSEIRNIKYAAYEMLHNNATMYITDNFNKSDFEHINSVITFISNGVKYFVVVGNNGHAIECSNPYSEEIVQTSSVIEGTNVFFKNTLKDSFSEIAVSMNKHYLNKTGGAKGKWIVTKFDYEDLAMVSSPNDCEIRIELLQNLNNKLTKSKLYIDEKPVGHIYFSLLEEGV